MKWDFTFGTILGLILTFFGVLIQFHCIKDYENSKEIKKWNIISIKQLGDRWHRSNSIYSTSGSSVFVDRWNNYIYNVYYPWESNLYMIDAHIKQNHPQIYNNFQSVCLEFDTIHSILNELRKLQNPSTTFEAESLNFNEKTVKSRLDSLEINIDKIKDTLSK